MDKSLAPENGAADRVVAACDVAGVDLVRFLYVDNAGLVRGKAAATRVLRQRMAGGIGFTVAMLAMNMLDELQPTPGMGPVGEVRLVPDPASFAVLPYAPGSAAMCCDLPDLDGRPWAAACPRSFLRSVLGEVRRDGFSVQAAYEPEFTVGRRMPGPDGTDALVPLDESVCFGTTGFTEAHDYVLELVRALGEQGLQVELYYPELGHGQQELSIRHADGLAAADRDGALPGDRPRSPAGAGCGRPSRRSRCPTRPATALTCTCRYGTCRPAASRPATSSSTSGPGSSSPVPATPSSAGCSRTCPRCSPSAAAA